MSDLKSFNPKPVDLAKRQLGRLLGLISDLRVAIGLLLVIALCSGLGTLVRREGAQLPSTTSSTTTSPGWAC
jgi:hypothetical protein